MSAVRFELVSPPGAKSTRIIRVIVVQRGAPFQGDERRNFRAYTLEGSGSKQTICYACRFVILFIRCQASLRAVKINIASFRKGGLPPPFKLSINSGIFSERIPSIFSYLLFKFPRIMSAYSYTSEYFALILGIMSVKIIFLLREIVAVFLRNIWNFPVFQGSEESPSVL